MELKNDFVNEEIVELGIDGKVFKYKPTTAGEENDWINEYTIIVDKKPVQDFAALNKCKLRNLVEVPYTQETIKEVTGIDKSWKEMNFEERWLLLSKLKSSVFEKILVAIKYTDDGSEQKKN
jgi:hypothetical protein